jgi:Spy/CpxP family protein refolding chaperone
MKNKKALITGVALVLTFASVSISAAHGPMDNGYMSGCRMMGGEQYTTNFTADQQGEIQAIEAKYQERLTGKETAIRIKNTELGRALADDSTTIKQANLLRSELYTLEQEYWQLRNHVTGEVSAKIGTTYYNDGNWGPMNCNWHDDHSGTAWHANNTAYMTSRHCNW